ncbi:hypothetical protein D918_05211 [Trichuris suis]|nr:hypothetical protein D918_05211 [Trichuris suis]
MIHNWTMGQRCSERTEFGIANIQEEERLTPTSWTDQGSNHNLSPAQDSAESKSRYLQRTMIRDYALAQLAGVPSGASVKSLPSTFTLLPKSSQERLCISCHASVDDGMPQVKEVSFESYSTKVRRDYFGRKYMMHSKSALSQMALLFICFWASE